MTLVRRQRLVALLDDVAPRINYPLGVRSVLLVNHAPDHSPLARVAILLIPLLDLPRPMLATLV
jgi:hypothetical protein